jgi:WD40 repeat protein
MTSLFISHSREDRALAEEIASRLDGFGFKSVFLDTDPHQGIGAGGRWEEELYAALRRSDAVIFVGTDAAAASRWCFAELALARSLGTPIFAVRAGGDGRLGLLSDLQWIELSEGETAYGRLLDGMRRVGLDPSRSHRWDPTRSPYPGLRAFTAEDAAVFFGRDVEIHRLSELLHPTLARGAGRWVSIIGPSGSGKSSLLFAGLLPGITQKSDGWVVVPPFVPGMRPTKHLADSLFLALVTSGHPRLPAAELEKRLTDQKTATQTLIEVVQELSETREGSARNVLISIDQAEELVTRAGPAEQQYFLRLLSGGLHEQSPLWVVCTLRSEYLTTDPERAGLSEVTDDSLVVEPLSKSRLSEVIAQPAHRADLEFEPGLVERMVEETSGGDALPLLAYTLSELTKDISQRSHIDHTDYEAIGGVVGALQRRADQLVRELTARGYGDYVLSTLLKLVSLDQDGEPIRRRLTRRALTSNELHVVDAFIDARLLTSSRREDGMSDALVEVAHEALMRQWPPLRAAIDKSRASIAMRAELEREAADWQHKGRDESYLLRGGRLLTFEEWVKNTKPDLNEVEDRFLAASRTLAFREIERIRRSNRRLRQLLTGVATLLALAIVSGIVAVYQTREAQSQAATARTRQLITEASTLRSSQPDLGVLLNVEAVHSAPEALRADAVVDLRQSLNREFHVTAFQLVHDDAVNAVAFSKDGSLVAAASNDRTLRLWDAKTGKPIRKPLRGHGDSVKGVAFNPADPGGGSLASASDDGSVRWWDTHSGQQTGDSLISGDGKIGDVAFSPDGSLLAAATDGGVLHLWDVAKHQERKRIVKGGPELWRVVFSPDGSLLAVASANGTIQIYEVPSGRIHLRPLTGHNGWVNSVAFNRDGSLLASAGYDGTVRLWDPRTGKQLGAPLTSGVGELNDAVFSPDGTILAAGGRASAIWLWDVPTRQPLGDPLTGHANAVRDLAFSPNGQQLASASYDRTVRLWEVQTRHPGGLPLAQPGRVNDIAVNPSKRLFASVSDDGKTRLWDMGNPQPGSERVLVDGTAWLAGVAFSTDGSLLATAGSDHKVRIWDVDTGKPHGPPLLGHTDEVSSVAFSSDGRMLASAGRDGVVWIWDVATGTQLRALHGHQGGVLDIAFRPDSTTLASVGQDSTVRVWDAETGNSIGEPMREHEGWALTVAYSRDGIIASAGGDGTVRLWRGGQQTAELIGHSNEVVGVAFRADGKVVASVGRDGTERLWDVAERRLIGEPLAYRTGELTSVAFVGEGFETASTGVDGQIHLTSLDVNQTVADGCAIANRNLSEEEWNRFVGAAQPYRDCMGN